MAPHVWGLDLAEIKWSKFSNKNMWNDMYHLRRTKFIVYQCAMIFCVVSESLGTAALSDYLDQQAWASKQDPRAHIHNNDYVGAGSYNIFVGVYIATIFGAAFFFDLFWPERQESRAVRIAWRVNAVFASIACLSTALTLTIITATHTAQFTGVPAAERQDLLANNIKKIPLRYRDNGRALAAVVFIWPGFVSTVASTVLMFYSLAYIEEHGAKATHLRDAEKTGGMGAEDGETDAMQTGRETKETNGTTGTTAPAAIPMGSEAPAAETPASTGATPASREL